MRHRIVMVISFVDGTTKKWEPARAVLFESCSLRLVGPIKRRCCYMFAARNIPTFAIRKNRSTPERTMFGDAIAVGACGLCDDFDRTNLWWTDPLCRIQPIHVGNSVIVGRIPYPGNNNLCDPDYFIQRKNCRLMPDITGWLPTSHRKLADSSRWINITTKTWTSSLVEMTSSLLIRHHSTFGWVLCIQHNSQIRASNTHIHMDTSWRFGGTICV